MENTSLSSRFLMLREMLGISQGELARAIEKTASFIGLIESGKSSISEETLSAICRAYHVNPVWLRNGDGNMFEEGYEIDPPDREGIPARIKTVRKEQKLSQAELAQEVRCSKSQIAAVEQGIVNASNDLLKRIADRCGVNVRWLISGTGNKTDREKIYPAFPNGKNTGAAVQETVEGYSMSRDPARQASPLLFGALLKERRKKAGFTQRELADRMHVTRSTVADWEADISKPEYSQIPVLCTLLDIRAYELFRLPPENGLSTLEKRIVGNLRSLSPANRRVVDKMISAMAEEELRNPEHPISD